MTRLNSQRLSAVTRAWATYGWYKNTFQRQLDVASTLYHITGLPVWQSQSENG